MKAITSFIKEHSLALLLVMGYLVLLAPYSLNYVFYMPDERHYVDAAIHMLKHGGYLSPINPDGGYRFLKPIFTYWLVLGSYALFGISEFSSRFPFLLTAGMVIWLTYRTTLLAFKKKEVALLALVIAGATPIMHRSTPLTLTDLLLLVFLQIMIFGVVALLVCPEKKNKHWWAVYLGAGMAVMTKGLPAIAFLLVALFFLLINPWKRFKLKDALHLPALLTGLVLGSFWYVAIYLQHGTQAIASFYEDQVGMRVAEKAGLIASNFTWSVLSIILIMFPFMLPGWRSFFYPNPEIKEHRNVKTILGFASLWVLAMIGMATLVSKFYYRYLIPVIPVMAMVMAFSIWSQQDKKAVQRLIKTIRIFAFILFITVNVAGLVAIILFFGPRWYFLVFTINIFTASYFFFKTKQADMLKAITIAITGITGMR